MKVRDVLDALATAAPWSDAARWDVSGLQLGDPDAPVDRVGVCHEVTDEVVTAVEAAPVDLLVTYHPLLFEPTVRVVAGATPAGRAWRLIRAGVALAVAHTSFDVAPGGTSDALAAALGLGEVSGFGPVTPAAQVKVVTFVPAEATETVAAAMARAGAGEIGTYTACSFRSKGTGAFIAGAGSRPAVGEVGVPAREPEVRLEMVAPASRRGAVTAALVAAHPYERPAFDVYEVVANTGFVGRVGRPISGTDLAGLVALVADRLGADGLRVAGGLAGPVGRVAVVPGSGGSLLVEAAGTGADVYVTGDVSHHRLAEARDRGLVVIDAGHAPTERPGMSALTEMVTAAAPGGEIVDLTGFDPTPWR